MPFARALHTIAINGCFNIGASTSAVNFILKLEMTTFLKDAAAATIAKQEGSSYSLFWLFGDTDETHRTSFEIKHSELLFMLYRKHWQCCLEQHHGSGSCKLLSLDLSLFIIAV